MKIYTSLDQIPPIHNAVVTQGTFDGVHAAHQVIIDRLRSIARQHNGETVLITFDPHPRIVLHPDDHGLKLIQTLEEKIEVLQQMGIDHLVIVPFTREFSRMSSMQFIRDIIVNRIGARYLVVGYNHRFGKNREGDQEQLNEFSELYGFEVEQIPEQDIDHIAVSSTKIRHALEQGDIVTANKYLLKPFLIKGTVVQGKQVGRTIGFPTANIELGDPNKLIPADGVYAVKVLIHNQTYGGMLNSGFRPTMDGKVHCIEVHLFDFNEEIYGEKISIEFVDKLRDEQRFSGIEALRIQLEKDKLHALSKLALLS
ncbi:MAG: bifunctional riboflavin kinase/FAD synthetase [Bacteroidia bacterium]|jgi:riboflavin kinase/FMN adenylyltransferase